MILLNPVHVIFAGIPILIFGLIVIAIIKAESYRKQTLKDFRISSKLILKEYKAQLKQLNSQNETHLKVIKEKEAKSKIQKLKTKVILVHLTFFMVLALFALIMTYLTQ